MTLLWPTLGLGQTTSEPREASAEALEEITIVGDREAARRTAGGAQVLTAVELERFEYSDIQRIIRQIPGVAVQLEDGYGLRPNLSIRGTATDRSSRVTLLEDNVLIAPAPYAAPAAYYFPTAGRMSQVEVLKGPAAISQGPYTVGGAINFLSTPIPEEASGWANIEAGRDETSRLHAYYGDSGSRFGWLAETHLWNSAGYQHIDRAGGDTGLDKDDWTLKFRVNGDTSARVYHQLDVKLQYAEEDSEQSYLGLTDATFAEDPYRRYAVSQLDNIQTQHDQLILRYRAELISGLRFTATAYSNNHERAWFKTEGLDVNGSSSAEQFSGVGWFSVIQAVNRGEPIGPLGAAQLQAILDGADTSAGSVQVRNNAREYYSRGVQFGLGVDWQLGAAHHEMQFGLRFHEDQEDRLQRSSTYHLENGRMVLDDLGLLGNAGNRIEEADATAFHFYDRIEWGQWQLTPGVRYESIDKEQIRWETRAGQTTDPSRRNSLNLRDTRENNIDVWIPGFGVLYALNEGLSIFGGVHKGFTAPGSAPGVREEESINYELGVRMSRGGGYADITAFRTDYENLLGVCTASSGVNCEIGDAFNGDAATINGLEVVLSHDFSPGRGFSMPFMLSYTYMDAHFDSDIADTDFFGDVSAGDPIPYIPEKELFASLGLQKNRWSTYINMNYVDEVCVSASCGPFEKTDDLVFVDVAAHLSLSDRSKIYGRIENVTEQAGMLGRQPYGARPNKDRSASFGVAFSF